MSRDWDAATYHRVSGPQVEMAGAVVESGGDHDARDRHGDRDTTGDGHSPPDSHV